ncbi:unnamed protein product [Oppiella nova]|uniref:Uncharacterized protein n=1 Tax=Oppiella nova TaxID=334625 RepID=A0A7R9QLS5_9ACAR|nr:unnamed protein product [Oppiella nova]CAG2168406.1 unnamed protein product [Oppiella nova]
MLTKQYHDQDLSQQRICVSDLTPKLEKSFTIKFWPKFAYKDRRIGVNIPENVSQMSEKIENYVEYIPRFDDISKPTFNSLFPTRIEPEQNNFWTNPPGTSKIVFAPNNSWNDTMSSYLISRWLKKTTDQVVLRFDIESNFRDFIIQFITFDEKMNMNISEVIFGDLVMDKNAKQTKIGNHVILNGMHGDDYCKSKNIGKCLIDKQHMDSFKCDCNGKPGLYWDHDKFELI